MTVSKAYTKINTENILYKLQFNKQALPITALIKENVWRSTKWVNDAINTIIGDDFPEGLSPRIAALNLSSPIARKTVIPVSDIPIRLGEVDKIYPIHSLKKLSLYLFAHKIMIVIKIDIWKYKEQRTDFQPPYVFQYKINILQTGL